MSFRLQAGTLVREVLDDAARARLASNVVGHLLNGVTEPSAGLARCLARVAAMRVRRRAPERSS